MFVLSLVDRVFIDWLFFRCKFCFLLHFVSSISVKTIYTIVVHLHIAVNTVVLYLYCLSNANVLIPYASNPFVASVTVTVLGYSVHGGVSTLYWLTRLRNSLRIVLIQCDCNVALMRRRGSYAGKVDFMYSYLKSEMRGLVFFGNGQEEVEVDGGVQLYIPLAVLCDGDFVRSADACLCGLFKVVRNRKRLQVDRWETIQRLDAGDLAPEARV